MAPQLQSTGPGGVVLTTGRSTTPIATRARCRLYWNSKMSTCYCLSASDSIWLLKPHSRFPPSGNAPRSTRARANSDKVAEIGRLSYESDSDYNAVGRKRIVSVSRRHGSNIVTAAFIHRDFHRDHSWQLMMLRRIFHCGVGMDLSMRHLRRNSLNSSTRLTPSNMRVA